MNLPWITITWTGFRIALRKPCKVVILAVRVSDSPAIQVFLKLRMMREMVLWVGLIYLLLKYISVDCSLLVFKLES